MSPWHVAVVTGRLVLGVLPTFLLGGYLLFAAIYCYRKGEVGGLRSPGIVARRESFPRFITGVAIIALWGASCIAMAVYYLVTGIR
jgi:hypothetical protein